MLRERILQEPAVLMELLLRRWRVGGQGRFSRLPAHPSYFPTMSHCRHDGLPTSVLSYLWTALGSSHTT